MAKVHQGRYMAELEQDVVVFVIGMRINKLLSVRQWGKVFRAMPPMIKELYTQREHGFLSQEMMIGWRTITMLQYWKSSDDLIAYARHGKHLTAWRTFNQKLAASNAVGIFHETYELKNYEAIYGNMPEFGLAKAVGHKAITKPHESARERLGDESVITKD
ncbi:DUF4188 domain-containing protein [Paenalkalicoccus suaedae]|uniref:DUF4188 domain-containing protein n=1 Tax=Paenalkalicoccus suaedae TaxID=2592382 RepID=A0A859FBU8_9BACI|nr:DUF4188 domain-containing protein [Paenalkalicoccus suaedae]QKS70014.1 DUF4188 domain-containing protein [Paenalkalicoccus suaedae]